MTLWAYNDFKSHCSLCLLWMETNSCMFKSGMAKRQSLCERSRMGNWSWWVHIIFGCGDGLDRVLHPSAKSSIFTQQLLVQQLPLFCYLTASDLWGCGGRSYIWEGMKSIKTSSMATVAMVFSLVSAGLHSLLPQHCALGRPTSFLSHDSVTVCLCEWHLL